MVVGGTPKNTRSGRLICQASTFLNVFPSSGRSGRCSRQPTNQHPWPSGCSRSTRPARDRLPPFRRAGNRTTNRVVPGAGAETSPGGVRVSRWRQRRRMACRLARVGPLRSARIAITPICSGHIAAHRPRHLPIFMVLRYLWPFTPWHSGLMMTCFGPSASHATAETRHGDDLGPSVLLSPLTRKRAKGN
jgi:hypothetical protein